MSEARRSLVIALFAFGSVALMSMTSVPVAKADDLNALMMGGTGMPTVPVLQALEQDLGKPVISSASAMMWHALRLAGVGQSITGYGRLLTIR